MTYPHARDWLPFGDRGQARPRKIERNHRFITSTTFVGLPWKGQYEESVTVPVQGILKRIRLAFWNPPAASVYVRVLNLNYLMTGLVAPRELNSFRLRNHVEPPVRIVFQFECHTDEPTLETTPLRSVRCHLTVDRW